MPEPTQQDATFLTPAGFQALLLRVDEQQGSGAVIPEAVAWYALLWDEDARKTAADEACAIAAEDRITTLEQELAYSEAKLWWVREDVKALESEIAATRRGRDDLKAEVARLILALASARQGFLNVRVQLSPSSKAWADCTKEYEAIAAALDAARRGEGA